MSKIYVTPHQAFELLGDVADSIKITKNEKGRSEGHAYIRISDDGKSLTTEGPGEKVSFAKVTDLFIGIMASNLTPRQKNEALNAYKSITNQYETKEIKEMGFIDKIAKYLFNPEIKKKEQVTQARELIQSHETKISLEHLALTIGLDELLKNPQMITKLKTTSEEEIKNLKKFLNTCYHAVTLTTPELIEYRNAIMQANIIIKSANDQKKRSSIPIKQLMDTVESMNFNRDQMNIRQITYLANTLENYLIKMDVSDEDKKALKSCMIQLKAYLGYNSNDQKKVEAFRAIENLKNAFYEKYHFIGKHDKDLGLLENVAKSINKGKESKLEGHADKKISDDGKSLTTWRSGKKVSFVEITEIFEEIMASNLTLRQKRDALTAYKIITADRDGKLNFFHKIIFHKEIEKTSNLIKTYESQILLQRNQLNVGLNNLLKTPQMIAKLKTTPQEIQLLIIKLDNYYHALELSSADQRDYRDAIEKANLLLNA